MPPLGNRAGILEQLLQAFARNGAPTSCPHRLDCLDRWSVREGYDSRLINLKDILNLLVDFEILRPLCFWNCPNRRLYTQLIIESSDLARGGRPTAQMADPLGHELLQKPLALP